MSVCDDVQGCAPNGVEGIVDEMSSDGCGDEAKVVEAEGVRR